MLELARWALEEARVMSLAIWKPDPPRAVHLVALVGAVVCLSACHRQNTAWDNTINSAQAEAQAEARTSNEVLHSPGAQRALAPLPHKTLDPNANAAP
jgi:hypothetical protein